MPTLFAYVKGDSSDGMPFGGGGSSVTFSTLRNGSGVGYAGVTSDFLYARLVGTTTTNRFSYLYRGEMTFDVTGLPPGAVIDSITLNVYTAFKANTLGLTNAHASLAVIDMNPTDTSNVRSADYESTTFTRLSDTDVSYSSIGLGWVSFDFNSAGLSQVNDNELSCAIALAVDVDAGNPNWSSSGVTYINVYSSRSATVAPYLEISYHIGVTAAIDTTNGYANGKLMQKSGSTWSDVTGSDLKFTTYSTTGATTVTYNSQDPSDILRSVLDNYASYGGLITYDAFSIADTGTTVSYTFTTQTILECINKILELAPVDWYWYVDPATNKLYFQPKDTSNYQFFTLGKDIKDMEVAKRTEGIINTIYFRGGDTTGSGDYLYTKYQDSTSVGLYGIRAQRYIDERVTVQNTADTIANSIIEGNKSPEIRLSATVVDSNPYGFGYDLELLNPGDVIRVGNVSGNTVSSLWDVATWDTSKWDYNISSIGSMFIQITRLEYMADEAFIYCSTTPPDVSKRIEDINRNLEAAQTADNPDIPT